VKRILGVALVVVLVLGVSGMAMARWGGPGMGMGPQGAMMGMGHGGGHGMGMGRRAGAGRCMQQQGAAPATATAIDDAKAKEIANEYVSKNLSGFQVDKLVKFDRPRGSMFQVELKGPKGEVRYLHINPWGNVRDFGAGRSL
jgi:hypothetical protein